MTIHVFFTYPETVGRTLEEIDMVFDTDIKPWRTNQIEDNFRAEIERKQGMVEEGEAKEGSNASHEEVV